MTRPLDRRHVLIAAASVPLVAACGGGDTETAGSNAPAGSDPTPTPGAGSAGSGSRTKLVDTAQVEVGGAVFLNTIVVTQPAAGDFHAFDRTCTHQGCPVTKMQQGEIHCVCHGSRFDPTTGAPTAGQAPSPLTEIAIVVEDGAIFQV